MLEFDGPVIRTAGDNTFAAHRFVNSVRGIWGSISGGHHLRTIIGPVASGIPEPIWR